MIVHEGFIAAFNYAIGPALIYESERSLRAIQTTGDPYIVIVPDTIPPRAVCSTDWRRVRGFVLARCEKDNLFTAFVIHQRRAAVRCVPAVLDDVREGRIRNGEPIAVDGVDGKVFVQPDAETIARFEALRLTPQPRVTKEYFPRLAREALQTANVPEIPPLPPRPELPDMLLRDSWQVAPGPNPMPKDVPTPADIRREVELQLNRAESLYELGVLATWQAVVRMHVSMFRDDPLSPEEVEALDQAVAAELHRLEEERKALAPPAPPPQEKSWHERWGLTPPEDPDSTGPVVERPRRAR